ncbi:hypothetical protein Nmel_007362 [Mimus melanotis]
MKSMYVRMISQEILYYVVSCFPFCKPLPVLVRDSCNAPFELKLPQSFA